MEDSSDSSNLSVSGYPLLIWKNSERTPMVDLAVYAREGVRIWMGVISKKSEDFYSCFHLALFHEVSYCSFLYWSLSSSLCTVFDVILSDKDKFSESTHQLKYLSLESLTSILGLVNQLQGNWWTIWTLLSFFYVEQSYI